MIINKIGHNLFFGGPNASNLLSLWSGLNYPYALPGGFSIGLIKYSPAFIFSDYSNLYSAAFGISKGRGLFCS